MKLKVPDRLIKHTVVAAVMVVASVCAPTLRAAEFEMTDKLTVNGFTLLKSSAEVRGTVGISTGSPQAALDIVSTGTTHSEMAQIWRDAGGVIKGSMSASGYLQAVKFIGDGAALTGITAGDNMGNHTATTTLNMAQFPLVNVSSIAMLGDGIRIATSVHSGASGILISTSGQIMTVGLGNGTAVPATRGHGAVDLQTYRTDVSSVAAGDYSVVAGGRDNRASTRYSAVLSGYNNTASGVGAIVPGGEGNMASGADAAVSGGFKNTASGGIAAVSGGSYNRASGYASIVSGGGSNEASNSYATVSGGQSNIVTGWIGTISGGLDNRASGQYSTVSGGYGNRVSGYVGVVSGGYDNEATNFAATVSGGEGNTASGEFSWAGGAYSSSTVIGSFTWSDSEGTENINSVADRTVFKNRGGFLVTGSTNPAMTGTLDRGVLITGNGLVGISTGVPYAALDVVSTGTASNIYAQIWRNGGGVVVASMTSEGKLFADGSGLTGVSGGSSGPSIEVSTINATATTPYGGVNITTNTFVNGSLLVQSHSSGDYSLRVSTSSTAGQYSIAVSSLGITNINSLVIENRTSDPVAPVTGQIWLRVD